MYRKLLPSGTLLVVLLLLMTPRSGTMLSLVAQRQVTAARVPDTAVTLPSPQAANEIDDGTHGFASAAPSPHDDGFDSSTLDSKWSWIREDPTHWSLTERPGFLRIITQRGDLYGGHNDLRNGLLQTMPALDFDVTTKVSINVAQEFHQGGLLIYQDSDNYLKLVRSWDNLWGGADVVFALERNGYFYHSHHHTVPADIGTLYLRISQSGTSYSGYYSQDGMTWTLLGLYSDVALTNAEFGLLAANGYKVEATEIPVDFQFFRVTVPGGGPVTLDLPIDYDGTEETFQTLIKDTWDGGIVDSWFDHYRPNYSTNEDYAGMRLFDCGTHDDPEDFRNEGKGIDCYGKPCYDNHNGIDFWPGDTHDVYAAAPGEVKYVCSTWPNCYIFEKGYGNAVLIDHGNGWATFYGHLASVEGRIREGVSVTREKIGVMGKTGNANGIHLHFGVYHDVGEEPGWEENVGGYTEAVDPFGWNLDGACGSEPDPAEVASTYLWKYDIAYRLSMGPEGGTARTPGRAWNLTVPPDALASTVTLNMWDGPAVAGPVAQQHQVGSSLRLRILDETAGSHLRREALHPNADFALPVTVAASYTSEATVHLDTHELTIYHWDEASGTWQPLDTIVDSAEQQAAAQTTQTGSFELQAPLLCPEDTVEPDDLRSHASLLQADGIPVSHRFDVAQDEDWFWLWGSAGDDFAVRTSNLAPGVDTLLEVYDVDGLTLLASDDDSGGGASSLLTWGPEEDGTYFLRVRGAPGSAIGCNATYELAAEMSHGIELVPDWNLITWPLEPLPDAQVALAEITSQGGEGLQVCRWLSPTSDWECHVQGEPFSNFPLELGQAYFVRNAKASTWRRAGVPRAEPVPVAVNPTWTLLGVPELPGYMTAGRLLTEATLQDGDCTEIYRWDAQVGRWEGHVRDLLFGLFDIRSDQGYAVRCTDSFTYVPGRTSSLELLRSRAKPKQPPIMHSGTCTTIEDLLVTNRRDVALSVTWRTDQPSTGWVEYAKDLTGFQNLSGLVVHDDQGEGIASSVHQVTLTGLTPETTYYFRVHSGERVDDNGGALYEVVTKKTALPPVPFLAYGRVETAAGSPAVGTLVRAWLVDDAGKESEAISALVDGYGHWSLNLPVQDCQGLQLKLEAISQRGSDAVLAQPACDVHPVPTVLLSEKDRGGVYLPGVFHNSP